MRRHVDWAFAHTTPLRFRQSHKVTSTSRMSQKVPFEPDLLGATQRSSKSCRLNLISDGDLETALASVAAERVVRLKSCLLTRFAIGPRRSSLEKKNIMEGTCHAPGGYRHRA